MKKRLIVLLLSMFMIIPCVLAACGKGDDHVHEYETTWTLNSTHHWHACSDEACKGVTDKAEHTYGTDNECDECGYEKQVISGDITEKSDITTVVNAVSDKMSDVAKTVTSLSNELTGYDNITEESTEDSDENVQSGSITATMAGFETATLSDFLYLQDEPAMILSIVEYVLNNATQENGYSNGFELNKVYSGQANIGFGDADGFMYVIMNEVTNGISMNADYYGNQSGVDIQMALNGFFKYDYDTDTVESIELNYIIHPIAYQVLSIKIDFASNSYSAIQLGSNNSGDINAGADFVSKFNAGTLTVDQILDYGFSWFDMCYGNLAENINDYRFGGFTYYSTNQNNTILDHTINGTFNSVYSELRGIQMLNAENIATTDAKIITYLQDAVTYGQNKSYISSSENNGRTYYYMPFVEYEDMVTVLTDAKATILADTNATDLQKDLITEALGYITHHGKDTYVGNLGTYNGLEMNMDMSTEYIYYNGENNKWGFKEFATELILSSNDYNVQIAIITKDGVVKDIDYRTYNYKLLKDIIDSEIEYYNNLNWTSTEEYQFLTAVKGYFQYMYNGGYIEETDTTNTYYIEYEDDSDWSRIYGWIYIRSSSSTYYLHIGLPDGYCNVCNSAN